METAQAATTTAHTHSAGDQPETPVKLSDKAAASSLSGTPGSKPSTRASTPRRTRVGTEVRKIAGT